MLFLLFRPKEEQYPVTYTLLVVTDASYADCFRVGAPILDGVGKGICGSIAAVEASPAQRETASGVFDDGKRTRFTLTVRGEGHKRGDMLSVGSLTLLPGKTVYLHAPCVCEGVCLSFSAQGAKAAALGVSL